MGGLVKESPYSMGESLNGRPGLNIEFEKTLIDKKLEELQAVGATNETIKHTMRDMGLERYGMSCHALYLSNSYGSNYLPLEFENLNLF